RARNDDAHRIVEIRIPHLGFDGYRNDPLVCRHVLVLCREAARQGTVTARRKRCLSHGDAPESSPRRPPVYVVKSEVVKENSTPRYNRDSAGAGKPFSSPKALSKPFTDNGLRRLWRCRRRPGTARPRSSVNDGLTRLFFDALHPSAGEGKLHSEQHQAEDDGENSWPREHQHRDARQNDDDAGDGDADAAADASGHVQKRARSHGSKVTVAVTKPSSNRKKTPGRFAPGVFVL